MLIYVDWHPCGVWQNYRCPESRSSSASLRCFAADSGHQSCDEARCLDDEPAQGWTTPSVEEWLNSIAMAGWTHG